MPGTGWPGAGDGSGMPFIRLRGWLAYYIWPSYAQRMFILDVKRDIRSLVPDGAELPGR